MGRANLRPMNQTGPRPAMTGTHKSTNAGQSKEAGDASKLAVQASGKVSDDDGESHAQAGRAHSDAAWKNRNAGNITKADDHDAQAMVHYEKAGQARDTKNFADQKSRSAQDLSNKAEKAAFGQDDKDPRSEKELHQDAAAAHDVAAKAHALAGSDTDQKFHEAKSKAHAQFATPKQPPAPVPV
jgi:hypothetical protein